MRHLESYATKTRLMGVVGVKSIFVNEAMDRYLMVLHLDFESYGVDGFHVLENPSKEEEEALVDSVCGGLGGQMVPLSHREVAGLFQEARALGLENAGEEAGPYLHLYEDVEDPVDTDKVYETIEGIHEHIHYLLMRLVAGDERGLRQIYQGGIPHAYPPEAALIKNSIERTPEGDYLATALVLIDNEYANHRYLVHVDGGEVTRLQLAGEIRLSLYEVALQVRKSQFFKIFEGEEVLASFNQVHDLLRGGIIEPYDHGILLTYFHPHNEHLRNPVYVISEDVRAYLFFTDEDQLVVVGDDEAQMDEVIHRIHPILMRDAIELVEGVEVDYPIFFDFLHSDTGDFLEFIEEELD